MGFLDDPYETDPSFDYNRDGHNDEMEVMMGRQMMSTSRKEAIDLTGDDTFYSGIDRLDDDNNF